jgi:ABC-type maltose transport system permease subunit
MNPTSFHVVGNSVSVALAVCAAGIYPMVSTSVATSRLSHSGKKLLLIGATL